MVSPRSIPGGSYVEIAWDDELPEEQRFEGGLAGALRPPALSSQELDRALRAIATDERIAGVLLRVDGFPGGWAQADEIRSGLLQLRAHGKLVVAYLETATSLDYYLASAADSLLLAPEGILRIAGLSARMSFLRGSLDKIGIGADYVAIGEFKSAPETFQRDTPSEPSRRQNIEFLDDLYANWLNGLAEARGLTLERAQALCDRGEFDPSEAVAEGLVDRLADLAALRSDGEALARVDVRDYMSSMRAASKGSPKLALIYAVGTIVGGVSGRDGFGGLYVGSDTLVEQLQMAREDDSIAAVVLRIDSPGGSATASDLIYRELIRLRERKPVVASLGNLAASGGYYIAMGADYILAAPTTLTGSIGVYAGKLEFAGLYEKLGISHEELLRGENAGAWSDLHPFSEAQRVELTERLARFYERFVHKVALERELDFPAADAVARGRIWSGLRASQCGLVDGLGDLPDAIAQALQLAGLAPSDQVGLESYQPLPSWLDRVLSGALRDAAQVSERPRILDQTLGLLRNAERTFDGSAQFHLPLRIRVQ